MPVVVDGARTGPTRTGEPVTRGSRPGARGRSPGDALRVTGSNARGETRVPRARLAYADGTNRNGQNGRRES